MSETIYEARKPSVLIAMATRGTIRAETTQWLMAHHKDANIYGVCMSIGNLGVERQRNWLVREFNRMAATHLFFLDDDVVPPMHAIDKLLSADKDIITGVVPIPMGDGVVPGVSQLIVNLEDVDLGSPIEVNLFERCATKGLGLERIGGCSGGCLLIKAEVLYRMRVCGNWFEFPPYTKPEYRMGEDMYFCLLAQKCGFEVWVDWAVKCHHYRVSRLEV